MSIDLTGGIDPTRKFVLAERPEDPAMRDSVSFWIVDDKGEVAFPRIGIEAVGGRWEEHGLQVNVAFPDGLVFRLRSDGKAWPPLDASGQPTVLGAGPLGFRCEEPFRTWTLTFDGEAAQTSTFDLMEGNSAGPPVEVRFDVETTMAAPPWIQGSLVPEARALLEGGEGNLMGGPRYEQVLRASGTIRTPGREHTFTGSGLRIRRQGVRHLTEFRGHCWQSALFPGGRAFGYIAYPPRHDGQPTFNEGYVFEGAGGLIPARVVQAPWLTSLQAFGQDVSLVLETENGIERIRGETVVSTFDIRHDDRTHDIEHLSKELPDFPPLQQAAVRYVWKGEETFGMLERSSPRTEITPQRA